MVALRIIMFRFSSWTMDEKMVSGRLFDKFGPDGILAVLKSGS